MAAADPARHTEVAVASPRFPGRPRVHRLVAASIALAALVGPALPVAAADGPAEPVIVLLREKKGGPRADVDAVVERTKRNEGVRPTHTFRDALRAFAAPMTPGQVRRLERDPDVEAIVPDTPVELAAQTIPAGVRRVGAVAAPGAEIDGRDERVDVDVAVIDTGIDPNHPDLNVVGGVDCVPDGITSWADQQGHGTHVAGTVGALDNGIGVVGAAPGARLWSVRVFDRNAFSRISWIVCGIDWVTAQRDANDPDGARIDVVNMSLRDEGTDDANCGYTKADPEHRAICASVAGGTTYVVAAGNDRRVASLWRPASYNEVITVSAIADFDGKPGGLASAPCTAFGTTDVDDTFADFSNYGNDVDIAAPGVCVRSTLRGGGYGDVSGTSMASPLVAGAAAVYKSLHPTAAPATVRAALRAAGSNAWNEATDRDATPEPLLDMSSFGAPPGFTMRAPTPPSATVWAGYGQATTSFTLVRGNGFDGRIDLAVDGLPSGVSATFSTPSLTSWATGPVTLTLIAAPGTPAGTWPAAIVATSAGGLETRRALPVTVRLDDDAPTATAPRLSFRAPGTMSDTSIPLRLAWSGSDVGSGISRFEQQEQRGTGPMTPVALSPATATSRTLAARFGELLTEQVRAVDRVSRPSDWAVAPRIQVAGWSEASSLLSWTGTWTSASATSAWGGRVRYATAAGASGALRFNGRAIAWLATMGPGRGAARVYLDGLHVATVDLLSSTTRYRQLVFARAVSEGSHTLRVVVYGSSGRPRVDVDGFLVLRRG